MTATPLAVIGMGALFADANGLQEYWRLLRQSKDAIRDVPPGYWPRDEYLKPDQARCGPGLDYVTAARGGFIPPVDFDPAEFGIPPTILEATDTAQLLSLLVGQQALENAGYGATREFDRTRCSVILGVTGTLQLVVPLGARLGHPQWRKALSEAGIDPAIAKNVIERLADEYVAWQENSFPGLLGNVVAGRIANRLNLRGTNCVVDAACASSLSAIHLAALELTTGRADMVLTGGVDAFNDIFMFMCFSKTQALSPTGDVRPFGAAADGTILGEGVGMVVLKRLEDARRDGDRVLAILKGVGSSSDGRSQSIYAPRAEGQAQALRNAYQISGVSPATIELVEAHGTGTRVGDVVEFEALRTVYSEARRDGGPWCALGSVKSQIGHTKAAAGAASLIKTIFALHHKVLPATIKADPPNPELALRGSPFYLSTETRPWLAPEGHPRRAAVSSFGFGGSNFHAVLEESEVPTREPAWDGSVQLLAWSADSPQALASAVRTSVHALSQESDPKRLAFSFFQIRQTFDSTRPWRGLLVVTPLSNMQADAEELCRHLETKPDEPLLSRNAFFGHGEAAGDLCLLFPGQGSQYVMMGRDLTCVFPEVREAVELAGEAARAIYPIPASDRAERNRQAGVLARTEITQPALAGLELGLLRLLQRFGVRFGAAAGHSFGEFMALRAGGAIGDETLILLARERGRLMAGSGEDRGTMLAVQAPLGDIEHMVAEIGGGLVLANRNSPKQGVVSGPRDTVAAAEAYCAKRGWTTRALPVSGAFHSPLMAEAGAAFAAVLETSDICAASIPVYSNVTAESYPSDVSAMRCVVSRQLLSPVRFAELIERSYADGVRTYLEVGPRTVLTSLTRAVLDGRDHRAIALDASGGKGCGITDLARALAALIALGHQMDPKAWESPVTEPRRLKMAVRLTGAPYRAPRPSKAVDKPLVQGLMTPTDSLAAARESRPSAAVTPSTKVMNVTHQPSPPASSASPDPATISALLETVQEGLRAIQEVQRQTAAAHEKFLEVQAEAQRSFQRIIESQQALATGAAPAMPRVAAPPDVFARTESAASSDATKMTPVIAELPSERQPAEAPAKPAGHATTSAPVDLEATLLSVVAELTGYPVETLDASMDMEADLGIDSIKRVEILASLQKRIPGLPPLNTAQLGSMRTLREVAQHIAGQVPITTQAACPAAAPLPLSLSALETELVEIVAELTGYPVETLSPDMDMEADLGIDSIKRVEILAGVQKRHPELRTVNSAQFGALRTLRQVAQRLTADADLPGPPTSATAEDGTGTASGDAEEVSALMLDVMAELTGYPRDMVHADMDLEADLGIDSIKRVEMLSALQKRLPALKTVSASEVASLRTVRAIATYLAATSAAASAIAQTEVAKPAGNQMPAIAPATGAADAARRQVVVAKEIGFFDSTGTGLPLPAGARIVVMGADDLARETVKLLSRQGFQALLVAPAEPLPAGDFSGLLLMSPAGVSSGEQAVAFLTAAFRAARDAGARLRASAGRGGALLATVTQFDGRFGLSGRFTGSPVFGGLAGLAKTAAEEWPEVRCRAVDLDATEGHAGDRAVVLVGELAHGDKVEAGISGGRRFTIALQDTPCPAGAAKLDAGDVVLVSGGARGVTAECAFALARATGARMILIGRSPAPAPEPPAFAGAPDAHALRKAVAAHLKASGNGTVKPAHVEAEVSRVLANREVAASLARFGLHGLPVEYHEVDVRDRNSLLRLAADVTARHGKITGLIHGAGITADKFLLDKTDDMFHRVFGTKVIGLINLLDALEDQPLKVIALFGSVSGRFGRQGQSDYAMANEALNKMAIAEQARRPSCRTVSINWGPWDGGMVTAQLKAEFERLGAPPMAVEAGCAAFVAELAVPAPGPAEVVIGSTLPPLRSAVAPGAPAAKRLGPVRKKMSVVFERNLSSKHHAFLDSHIVGGNHVLPVAVILEWLGHAALHENPGLCLTALRDLRIFKGVLLNGGTHDLFFLASRPKRSGGVLTLDVELRGAPNGNGELLHARATAVVSENMPAPVAPAAMLTLQPYPHTAHTIYSDILFHGSHFQAIEHVSGHSPAGLAAVLRCAPPPAEWMLDPPRSEWLADPLVTDGCMQLGALWCHQHLGAVSLPSGGQQYIQFRRAYPKPPSLVTAALCVRETTANQLVADVDILDEAGVLIARFERFEWTADQSLREAFRARTLAGAET